MAGTLKLDLAQFRELEAFATFGSELDKVSQGPARPRLPPGRAAQAAANGPLPVEEQVVSIFAGTKGFLDDLAVADVRRFEAELLEAFRTRHTDLLDRHPHERRCPTADQRRRAVQGAVRATGGATRSRSRPVDADGVGDAASDKTLATE